MHLLTDGDARGCQVRSDLRVVQLGRVSPRIHQHANTHAAVERVLQRRTVAIVGHEPERDVDAAARRLAVDQVEERRAAVLLARITESIQSCGRTREDRNGRKS
jgi:hypothetical protein